MDAANEHIARSRAPMLRLHPSSERQLLVCGLRRRFPTMADTFHEEVVGTPGPGWANLFPLSRKAAHFVRRLVLLTRL